MSVHIGARQCLLRFATVIMTIKCECVCLCVELPKSRVCVCVWTVKQEFWDQERDRRINTLFNGVRRCCIQYTHIHTVMHQCGKVLCSWQQQKTKCRKLKWEVTGHGLHAATETDGLTLLRSVLLCFSFSFFCICHLAQPHYVHACIHANTHTHTLTLACVCFALFLLHI